MEIAMVDVEEIAMTIMTVDADADIAIKNTKKEKYTNTSLFFALHSDSIT